MSMKTPFFSAFGSLLFGRRAHRKLPEIPEDLNLLRGVFGSHVPKGSLAQSKSGLNSRRRFFSTDATFWAFLFQVLSPSCACREVVRKLQAWWTGCRRKKMAAGTAAYCQARGRLKLSTLERIFCALAAMLERRILGRERWMGQRRVKILDGTGLSMPDTRKNQQRWPQSKGQKPGCGFPVLRMVGLFCLSSGAMLRYAFGNKHDQENHLARRVLDGLERDDVLLADRGFCSYGLIAVLLARGVDCVMRLHQRRSHDVAQGRRLAPGDQLVEWPRPCDPRRNDPWAAERPTLPARLAVRLVSFRIEVPGFRTEQVTVATTLLDPKQYPAQALAALYRARWNIELRYSEIKTTMGADVLRCKSPAMIEKELCMNAIGYNLVRCVMQEAAQRHDVKLERISFKGSMDTVRHFADAIHAATGKRRRQSQLYDELLAIIASDPVPSRPDRNEPRARKRRPKPYQLLSKPRHQMRVIPHRNRYRADDQKGLN
jgi:Transposase DDE domain